MSVNAYLIKKINSKTKDNELIIEKILKKTPTFNLNSHSKIWKLLQEHHCDNVNEDLNGEIVIDKYVWKNILNNLSTENYTSEELKIIKNITKELKNKEIIYYDCF